ncbi:MAG: MBL fold metallo-hydrolase [Dehalococcoidia bacterium]|nr:MBL fold metallo-hydrolase [Dehalococcoidia bacterium]
MALHYDGEVRIYKVSCKPFDNNAYIVVDPQTNESVIIDTPDEPEKVLEEAKGTRVKAILITHNHQDHLVGLERIRAGTNAPVWIHSADAHALSRPPEHLHGHGEVLLLGRLQLKVLHTPGHTAGAACYVLGRHLFSGDTLFPGGPGHSSTPESLQQTIKSITGILFPLSSETAVYPGHGADTDLDTSKAEYHVFAGKPHQPDLRGDINWLTS